MISTFSCRLLSIVYRRRCIRVLLLVFFIFMSIGLMAELQQLLPGSNFDNMVVMSDASLPSPHFNLRSKRKEADNFMDEETRKARERFGSIGVNLVHEDKIHIFRSFLTNSSGKPLGELLNGFRDTRNDDEIRAQTNLTEYVGEYDSMFSKGFGSSITSPTSTPSSDKIQSTKEGSKYNFLVILVISKPSNVLLRQAARKTWAKDAHYFSVLVRFVVGRLEGWDEIIDRETSIHSDMIVMEEQDTYETLPNKVLEGFGWALRQSSVPLFVMKIDDDTIVNLPYLVAELSVPVLNATQILGAISVGSRVVRDPRDKWAVSLLDYPFSTYPPYAFGGGYVMSSKCASILVEARFKTTDWIHLEDVYITGILATKSGISHISHEGFAFWTSAKAKPCDFVQRNRITTVNHSEKEFFEMHEGIQNILRSGQTATSCTLTAAKIVV